MFSIVALMVQRNNRPAIANRLSCRSAIEVIVCAFPWMSPNPSLHDSAHQPDNGSVTGPAEHTMSSYPLSIFPI